MAKLNEITWEGTYLDSIHIGAYHVDLTITPLFKDVVHWYRLRLAEYDDFSIETRGLYAHATRSLQIAHARFDEDRDDDYEPNGKISGEIRMNGREGRCNITFRGAEWTLEDVTPTG